MKRMWIGAGLLGILLAAGLLLGTVMEARVSDGAARLRQAAQAARAGDWEKAESLTGSVRADWDRLRQRAGMLTTHEDLERIELYFDQLPSYARVDGPSYSALCAALAQQLQALGEVHGCSLENLL